MVTRMLTLGKGEMDYKQESEWKVNIHGRDLAKKETETRHTEANRIRPIYCRKIQY